VLSCPAKGPNGVAEKAFRYYQRVRAWDWTRRYVPEWAMCDLADEYEWTGAVILTDDGTELFEMRILVENEHE